MEVLKQNQYTPFPVEEQVISFYAVTNGFIDDIKLTMVKKFEKDMLTFFNTQKKDILNEILDKKKLDDSLTEKVAGAIREFKAGFNQEG